MKKIITIFLCIVLTPLVSALQIDLEVSGKIGGYIEYFEMEESVNSVQIFSIQWYNTESANCRTWMEFEIYEKEGLVDTIWSEGKDMPPGVSRYFDAYWLPSQSGNYSVKITVHHCNEIIESGMMDFSVTSSPQPENILEMEAENLPDRKIKVTLKSDRDMENVIIIPKNYPLGWIFSGEKVEKIESGETTVVMDYVPSVWTEETVKLRAISLDGQYSSEETSLTLKEKKYFWDEYGYGIFLLVLILLILSLTTNLYLFLKKRKTP